jgi:hypothetical protein
MSEQSFDNAKSQCITIGHLGVAETLPVIDSKDDHATQPNSERYHPSSPAPVHAGKAVPTSLRVELGITGVSVMPKRIKAVYGPWASCGKGNGVGRGIALPGPVLRIWPFGLDVNRSTPEIHSTATLSARATALGQRCGSCCRGPDSHLKPSLGQDTTARLAAIDPAWRPSASPDPSDQPKFKRICMNCSSIFDSF